MGFGMMCRTWDKQKGRPITLESLSKAKRKHKDFFSLLFLKDVFIRVCRKLNLSRWLHQGSGFRFNFCTMAKEVPVDKQNEVSPENHKPKSFALWSSLT